MAKRLTRTLISGVVKAECYGHGLALAKYIESELDCFSVAGLDEAIALRKLGVSKPIHILGSIGLDYSCSFMNHLEGIILTVTDMPSFSVICQIQKPIIVDIEINTGMNRTGVTPKEFFEIIPVILPNNNITLRGVFTHFADGGDIDFCGQQLDVFEKITEWLPKNIIRHCCATNFCKLPKRFYMDAIRLGLGMYGYGGDEFEPTLSAWGKVVQINIIKAGDRVGYGNTVLERDTRTATVDFGYGDGVSRALSHRNGKIAISGQLFDIVGTVCMDMIMLEIGNADISVGNKAYYISKAYGATQIAKCANTIEYEILTAVNLRSKYVYKE